VTELEAAEPGNGLDVRQVCPLVIGPNGLRGVVRRTHDPGVRQCATGLEGTIR
jgi:hypothetical protein